MLYFTVLHQNYFTHSAHCKGVLRDSITSRDSHALSRALQPLISPASKARVLPHSQALCEHHVHTRLPFPLQIPLHQP